MVSDRGPVGEIRESVNLPMAWHRLRGVLHPRLNHRRQIQSQRKDGQWTEPQVIIVARSLS